ncbi:MAG: ATP-binding protein [Bacteroidales bacterium]|nr:ATP-binding protein [Bacteroidales bacterium]
MCCALLRQAGFVCGPGLGFGKLEGAGGRNLLPEFETLDFTRWEEIIKDKVLCSALVDRLCHKAFMVNMTGPSYRVKETQNIFKKL